MLTGYFEQSIGRANRNLGLAGAGILLCGAILVLYQYQLVRYFILGPQLPDYNEILFMTPTDLPGQFIRIEAKNSVEIGTETFGIEGVGGQTVRARFHVVYWNGDTWLIRADPFAIGQQFDGRFTPIPDEVTAKIIGPARKKRPDLMGGLHPVMFDATDQRASAVAYIGLVVVLCSTGVGCLVNFARRVVDIRSHQSYRDLRRFGVPTVVALNINAEAQDLMPEPGKAWFTTSWIVVPTLFGVRAFRYKDLVWVHVKSTTFLLNFVPLVWSRCAVFHDRFGIRTKVARGITIGKAQRLVGALADRAPWILYGFAPQYSTGWSTDREGIIRYVDAQRARYEGREGASFGSLTPARRTPRLSEPPSEW